MRPAVEIDRPLRVVEADAGVEREQPLLQRIDVSGDPHVGEPAHAVVGCVLAALIFADSGDAIGVVAVGSQAGGIVDRQAEVVAELGTGKPLGPILVIDGRPLSGEINLLREDGRWCRSDRQREEQNARPRCRHGAASILLLPRADHGPDAMAPPTAFSEHSASYSERSASSGLSLAARRAGSQHATSATTTRSIVMVANTRGSRALTP